MGKSFTIVYNAVREDSIVHVKPSPILFGENLPSFYIKPFPEDKKQAVGFVFQDNDRARKFLIEFGVACWKSDKDKTLEDLKILVTKIEQYNEAKEMKPPAPKESVK